MKVKFRLAILAVSATALTLNAQTVETVTANGLFEPYGVALDLHNPDWSGIATNLIGNGQAMQLPPASLNQTTRFYRVRLQQ